MTNLVSLYIVKNGASTDYCVSLLDDTGTKRATVHTLEAWNSCQEIQKKPVFLPKDIRGGVILTLDPNCYDVVLTVGKLDGVDLNIAALMMTAIDGVHRFEIKRKS